MGGIFSGHTDFEHACCLIIPKDNGARARPTDDVTQAYQEKWADINFSIEHHCTYQALALVIVQGFNYDSLEGYDPELEFRDPRKKKDRVIGRYTKLGDLIAKKKYVFICYLHKSNAKTSERKQLRQIVRRNSRGEMGGTIPKAASDPAINKIPKKKKRQDDSEGSTHT
jgi:hypothetical protein